MLLIRDIFLYFFRAFLAISLTSCGVKSFVWIRECPRGCLAEEPMES